MVRYLADTESRRGVFLCDGCGRPFYRDDKCVVHFTDYEKFLEDSHARWDDPSQCQFLCLACHRQRCECRLDPDEGR